VGRPTRTAGTAAIGGWLWLVATVGCGRSPIDLPPTGAAGGAAVGTSAGLAGSGPTAGAAGGAFAGGGGTVSVAGAAGSGAAGVVGGAGSSGAAGAAGSSGQAGGAGGLQKKLGESCVERIDCASTFCENGVCCATGCDQVCGSCALPGRVGTCVALKAGIECAPPKCDGSASIRSSCDGFGTCQSAGALVCDPFACNPKTGDCNRACSSDADCFNAKCINGSCGAGGVGAKCALDSDCSSGACAQGVCCNRPCRGSCLSCALPGRAGVCSPVAFGAVDPSGACVDQGAATCGTNGRCDGSGGCAHYQGGTACGASKCIGNYYTVPPGVCDGAGTCVPGWALGCGPYLCNPATGGCSNSCVTNAQCATGQCFANKCGVFDGGTGGLVDAGLE
jgi:hypothetical protein